MARTYLTRVSSNYITTLVIAIVLAGFVALLIGGNFRSQRQVQQFALADLHRNQDKRAAAISYFFSERRTDVKNLAMRSEIIAFFENKALGMSMEYGLKASLAIISEAFGQILKERKLGNDPIYVRLALIDTSGESLVDATSANYISSGRGSWKKDLFLRTSEPQIVVEPGAKSYAVIFAPCYFREHYVGQIVAWLPLQTLYDHFIRQIEDSGDFLIYDGGDLHYPLPLSYVNPHLLESFLNFTKSTASPASQPGAARDAPTTYGVPWSYIHQFLDSTTGAEREKSLLHFSEGRVDFLVAFASVVDTPFSLIKILPENKVFGATRPWHMLMIFAALAILLMGGAFITWKNHVKTLVLQARLEESSERELAVEKLRRQNESILNSAGEGILGLDKDGRHTFVNPAAAKMLGYATDDLIGQKCHDLYHHQKEDRGLHTEERCRICQSIMNGRFRPVSEEAFWRKDGSSFKVRYSCSPIVERDEVVGSVITFLDITEQKLLEKEKKKLESHLRQAQKLEAIGNLAGGIAHDFNNVLGIIIGYSELVSYGLPDGSGEKKKIEQVLKAADRARDLVRQILTFSRAEDGLERHPIDIRPIVKESLKFLKATLPATIEIRQNLSDTDSLILAHPTQIHQLLTNLCTNAAHAMEEKGGILEVGLEDHVPTLPFMPPYSDMIPGPCVRFTVSDTGHGMDPITLERIFDPYFTTKGIGKGTGLGLPIVHGIVKRYGGAIQVSSTIGKGTIFHVYFPAVSGKPAPAVERTCSTHCGTERILFVDDETELVELWGSALELLGYKLVAVTSSLQALQLFEDHPQDFDLLITDYSMPKMSGLELAENVLRTRPNMPIILCTGLIEDFIKEKSKRIGIRAFLGKPLEIQKTTEVIRDVLEQFCTPLSGHTETMKSDGPNP